MKRKEQYIPKQILKTLVQHSASPISWESLREKSATKAKEIFYAAEGANFYELKILIPNRRRDDFNIVVKGRMLHIKLRPIFTSTEPARDLISILNRPVILPGNLDPDFMSAEYQSGTLTLHFFKSMSPCMNQVEEIFVY
jgi:hypothetical protein